MQVERIGTMNSERNSDFGQLVSTNLFLLKLIGLIGYEGNAVGMNIMSYISFACLAFYLVPYAYEILDKRGGCLECIAIAMSTVGLTGRYFVLLLSRDKCKRMLEMCELLWPALSTSEEKQMVGHYVRITRGLTYLYLSSCCSTILMYTIATLMIPWTIGGSVTNSTTNGESSFLASRANNDNRRHLPYAFPGDIHDSPWYEIVFATQISVVAVITCVVAGVDMIGPLFTLIACGHFEVIRSRLEGSSNIEEKATSRWAAVPSQTQIERLRICLAYHRTVLEFCQEIESLTNIMFMIQLLSSTYNISIVGLKLVGNDPDKYKYTAQLMIVLMQLLLCNWPADLLASKSEDMGRAAYFGPWYRFPCCLRGPTIMLLIRSRRPVRLTAGKFVILSLETFGALMSSAASFFTVVGSVN